MRILFALITAAAGLLLVFGGYRFARFAIPILGFVAGLSLGGALISDADGTSFLGTVLGVSIGILLGAVLALFAYFYYSLAIVVLAASLGYWAGSSFMLFLGLNRGLLSTLVGIGLGLIAGIAALLVNAPKYSLIILTSVIGAVTTVGGILLLFNEIPLSTFSYAAAHVSISNSWFWSLTTLALAIIGMVEQNSTTRYYEFEEWSYSDHTHHHIPPTTHPTRVG